MTRRPGLGIAMLFVATGTFAFVGLTAGTSAAASYLNSSEPQCNGSDPTVLMCDDFEDGDWAQTNCNGFRNGTQVTTSARNYAANDGWCLWPFYQDNFTGTSNFTVNVGAAGTNRAATSSVRVTTGTESTAMMGMHGLPGDYTELWFRMYLYIGNDYVSGHEKMPAILPVNWNPAGNDLLAMSVTYFGEGHLCWISYKHQSDGIPTPEPGNFGAWMCQILSNGTGIDSLGNSTPIGARLFWQRGHWYYLEVHVKLNTGSNYDGKFDFWLDDCGTNGLGCTGPGTLRATHSNVLWWTPSDRSFYGGNNMQGIWIENYSMPVSQGTTYYDQIVVATRRIGPMTVGPSVAPAAPTALSVQ